MLVSSSQPHGPIAAFLPLVDRPQSNENIQGYVLRLSELNLYERPRWLYGLLVKDFSDLTFSSLRKCSQELPNLTGLAPEALQSITYGDAGSPNYNAASIGARFDLPVSLIDIANPKVCPECLRELGAVKSVWDLRPYVACAKHGCFLINKCSNSGCRRRISWWRPNVGRCAGCDEPFWHHFVPKKASYFLQEYSQSMEKRWVSKTSPCSNEGGLLDAHTSTDYFKLVQFLLSKLRRGSLTSTHALAPEEVHLNSIVAKTFHNWPANIDVFMGELVKSDTQNGLGFSLLNTSQFGGLFQAVMAKNAKPHLKILQDATLEFITASSFSSRVTAKGGNRVSKSNAGKQMFLTRTETMKKLSISARTFRRLFAQGALSGEIVQMGKQHVYRVTLDSVENYKKPIKLVVRG